MLNGGHFKNTLAKIFMDEDEEIMYRWIYTHQDEKYNAKEFIDLKKDG